MSKTFLSDQRNDDHSNESSSDESSSNSSETSSRPQKKFNHNEFVPKEKHEELKTKALVWYEKCEKLNSKISELKTANVQLSNKLKSTVEHNRELSDEVNRLTNKYNFETEKVVLLKDTEIARLTNKIEDYKEKIKELKDDIKELKETKKQREREKD